MGQVLHQIEEIHMMAFKLLQQHLLVDLSSGGELLIAHQSPVLALLVELQQHLDGTNLRQRIC